MNLGVLINISNLDSTVCEYSVLVSFHVKVKQGNKTLGGLVEVHTTLGSVDSDIWSSPRPRCQTEAGQPSEIFPRLAGDKDVFQLAQSSTQTELT